MNINAIENDESTYIVTDQNHNITKIKTDKTNPSEILNLENEMESMNYKLEQAKEMLQINKQNTIGGEIMNGFTYITLLVTVLLQTQPCEIISSLILMYLVPKLINVSIQGTRFSRHTLKKALTKDIEELEQRIEELTKKYGELKAKAKYQEIEKITKEQPLIRAIEYEAMINSIPKVKVLTRKK